MTGDKQRRVAVLKGGRSAEREVSLVSGRECASALREAGFEIIEIDAGSDLAEKLIAAAPDVVFNALHGRWGEDGCVQGLLEWLKLPYTHSGVFASAAAMDKERAKQIYAHAGLPVAPSVLASKAQIAAAHVMAPPYVVKPYNEGSSVGIHIVMEGASSPPRPGPDEPELLMVEKYVAGRELTTTVMGDRALSVTDIRAEGGGWYDYHAKYAAGGSSHTVPADIPRPVFAACLDYALRAHRALGCRGVSRTDFRWDDTVPDAGVAQMVVLEVNTQPGMTSTSLSPEQAAHCGVGFPELVAWMVEDASCGR